MPNQRILHIDMDAFFASVEQARDPALRGKALIIGGRPGDKRGVVSTASYEARKFGVHSAMPIAVAYRLCPHGIYLRGNHALYGEYSRKVRAILDTVSPAVEMASIDEAYVDITGSLRLFGGDDGVANFIRREVRAQLDLPCSIAIASNRLVAKVATEAAKPDGYRRIAEGEEAAFLAPLDIKKLPGAGPKTCEALRRIGIHLIGDLTSCPTIRLERAVGLRTALWLQRAALGQTSAEIHTDRVPKQVSRETTFAEDTDDWNHLESVLSKLSERCCHTLRQHGLEARRVILKVRYEGFDTRTFAHTLPLASNSDHEILAAVRQLMAKARTRMDPVRLIGVALGEFDHGARQLDLFGMPAESKWDRVLQQVDGLREKGGFGIVHFGAFQPRVDK